MSSKEITTFVVDLSLSMGRKYDADHTDLSYGLKYFYHSVINKIKAARKTDFISLITCHSKHTQIPGSNGDKLMGINVVEDKIIPQFGHLSHFNQVLTHNVSSNDDQSDWIDAMIVAIGLMQKDARLQFTRNIVIITNAEDPVKSFESDYHKVSINAINELNINVSLIGINFDDHGIPKSECKLKNEHRAAELFSNYKNGRIIDALKVEKIITMNPVLKRIRPMNQFKGACLNFGNNGMGLQGQEQGQQEQGPEISGNQAVLSLKVEVYPAVRPEKFPDRKQYVLSSNGSDNTITDVLKVVSDREYFIYENQNNEEDEAGEEEEESKNKDHAKDQEHGDETNDSQAKKKKTKVPKNVLTKGYKYSNSDLHSFDDNLAQMAKLPCNPSIDIIGFIKAENLPVAFFTNESNYVVPSTNGSPKDFMGFNSLCQSLIEMESIALLRYVVKPNVEIDVCALLPSRVAVDGKYVYCCQMVRLPYREDEKIGTFPRLINQKTTDDDGDGDSRQGGNDNNDKNDKDDKDDLKIDELSMMQSFILSKDLDKPHSIVKEEPHEGQDQGHEIDNDSYTIENERINMRAGQSLNDKFTDSLTTNSKSKLLSSNPAIHKFNMNLNKMIEKASKASNLHEFLNEPNFLQKHMTADNVTNLFNLKNILLNEYTAENKHWLQDLNKESISLQQQLAKDHKPFNPDKRKKRKREKTHSGGGNYGNDIIEEDFDLEAILAE